MDTGAIGEQTTAVDYFRPIWARRWLIAFIVAIATAGTYVYYNGKPRVYGSSATLYTGGSEHRGRAQRGGFAGSGPRTNRSFALDLLSASRGGRGEACRQSGDPRIDRRRAGER